MEMPAHLGTQKGTQTLALFFQDFPYMHFYWMVMTSKINFIFQVIEPCFMIENLILKKKLT